ncbi:MAG: response regulator [Methylococcales bacterium]|nr:response regulator [Methylococcales bacterium]
MTTAFASSNHFSPVFPDLTNHLELNIAAQKLLNAHVLISLTDVNGAILDANEKFCAVSGYNKAELLGKSHSIINSGYHDKAFMKELWKTISSGQTWHGQFCNRKKNGELYWVDSTIAPLLDESGKPYQYLSIRRDITEQKNSELKLLTLKQGLEASNEMVLITDAKGLIEYVNPAFCRLSGWSAEQIIGQNPVILDSETSVNAPLLAEMNEALKQGNPWSGRLLNRRQVIEHNANVEIKFVDYWAAVNVTPILKSNGKINGYVQIQRDCSVLVAREESLRTENVDKAARLAISAVLQQPEPLKNRFNQVLTFLFELPAFNLQRKGGVFIKNDNGKYLNLFVHQGNFSDDFMQREQRIAVGAGICGIAATLTEITVSDSCLCDSYDVVEQNVSYEHGHYIVPMIYANNVLGVLFLYTDTQPIQNVARMGMLKQVGEMMALALLQEQAHLAMAQSRDEAMKMAEMKTEFLANMSHEIRTPMNGILGMLDLLKDSSLSPEQSDLLHTALSSTESLLNILNDILDFSKLEAKKVELENIEFNLPTLVEEVCALFSSHANNQQLELTCFIPINLPVLWLGDPTRLRQILLNLLGNALKFTVRGEVNVRVFETVTIDGQAHCRFEIQDSGIGITAEQQKQLFKPFTQADTSTTRKFGGTGLGLSICKGLVDMMNGTIGVKSVFGEGSTFWFDLPLTPALAQPSPPLAYLSGMRVLLVDDNTMSRENIAHYLNAWQCVVQTENSGNAALLELEIAALSEAPYDVAIIDLQLPDIDGSEVARAMSSNPLLSNTPRVLLSANGFISETERRSAGFEHCLFKPVRSVQLFDALFTIVSNPSQNITTKKSEVAYTNYADKHILVVEDNTINQKVIAAALARFNITPDVAPNGLKALELLEKNHYDLILMDCQMPLLDGYETTQRIRALTSGEHVIAELPIVALTATNTTTEREKCIAAGMNDYLSKPFNRHAFSNVLQTWLKPTHPILENEIPATVLDETSILPSSETQEIWNEVATLAQLDGDRELFEDMVRLFLQATPNLLKSLKEYASSDELDFNALADTAHALKGMVNHFCAKTLVVKIAALENAARENKIADFKEMVTDISALTTQLMDALTHRK